MCFKTHTRQDSFLLFTSVYFHFYTCCTNLVTMKFVSNHVLIKNSFFILKIKLLLQFSLHEKRNIKNNLLQKCLASIKQKKFSFFLNYKIFSFFFMYFHSCICWQGLEYID